MNDLEARYQALVAQGLMIKQIAALMNLSNDTVEKYAVTMRAHIHAKTTAHAVAIGYQEGLLP